MGPTTRHQQALYLDHEKAVLLDELSAETRIAKAVLLHETAHVTRARGVRSARTRGSRVPGLSCCISRSARPARRP